MGGEAAGCASEATARHTLLYRYWAVGTSWCILGAQLLYSPAALGPLCNPSFYGSSKPQTNKCHRCFHAPQPETPPPKALPDPFCANLRFGSASRFRRGQ